MPDANHRPFSGATIVLLTSALLAAGAACWFICLQVFVVQKLCLYCLICHLCGLAIAPIVVRRLRQNNSPAGRRSTPADYRLRSAASSFGAARISANRKTGGLNVWRIALSLAGLSITALIFGQIIIRPRTFQISAAEYVPNTEFAQPLKNSPNDENPSNSRDYLQRSAGASSQETVIEPTASDSSGPAHAEEDLGQPSADDLTLPAQNSTELASEGDADSDRPTPDPAARVTVLKPAAERKLTFLRGKLALDIGANPLLGSPSASHVVIEFLDYTCHRCRRMYSLMEQARQHFGEQFAIIVLPVPLDSSCNPYIQKTHPDHREACRYVQLAMAVWHLDRSRFEEYHHWLMDGEHVPPLEDAVQRAASLVGDQSLREALRENEISQRIRAYAKLLASMRSGLPLMVAGDHLVKGVPDEAEELFGHLRRLLGVQPAALQE
jgi:hypothetical protein